MRRVALLLLALSLGCGPRDKRPAETPDSVAVNAAVDSVSLDEVMDTVPLLDPSDTLSDAERKARESPRRLSLFSAGSGMPLGPSGTDKDQWCRGDVGTGSYTSAQPSYILSALRTASACQHSLMLVNPRKLMTANGQSNGRFSVTKAKASLDAMARAVPADSIKKYMGNGTWDGEIILDDMTCARCWGGAAISQAEAEQVYAYAQQKMPDLAWGIRGLPAWVKGRPSLSEFIDFGWAQYTATRKDHRDFYRTALRDAKALPFPMKLAAGLNIYHFSKPNDGRPVTASELDDVHGFAIDSIENCFAGSWKWWDGWRDAGRGAVWDKLIARAKAKSGVSCKR